MISMMEQFFTPTRSCLQDMWEKSSNHRDDPFEYTEVKLAVPVNEFQNYPDWDCADLLAFLTGGGGGAGAGSNDVTPAPKILWITNDAFLVVEETSGGSTSTSGLFHFEYDTLHDRFHAKRLSDRIAAQMRATSGKERTLSFTHLNHPSFTEGVGVFWRAISTSNSIRLDIQDYRGGYLELPSGPLLSQFLRESPSLQVLEFNRYYLREEHCRALATLERIDFEIILSNCVLDPKEAKDIFVEWARHNKVLTELNSCQMGRSMLLSLSGKNSVKKLVITGTTGEADRKSSDETWSHLFRSLSTHPLIEVVSLIIPWTHLSATSKTARMHAIIQMLRLNTVVHTIMLANSFRREAVYQNSILPRLEMNRSCFEVQRQAVTRADPSIRPPLLGRALHAVQYNPNLVFQLLSENVPAFV
jgi:hypothetical protein